VIKEAKKKILQ